jgi:hypothetical protein
MIGVAGQGGAHRVVVHDGRLRLVSDAGENLLE